MPAPTLMIQGTASHVGKSLLAAAACRLFARRGWRVLPFKAQNMSNNAAVCADGGEIGRAQALQALAAGVAPTADMNPVLLKPEADARSQVIVHGRVWRSLPARDYYQRKAQLWGAVVESLDRLRQRADLVVIEGAGSPVELNLKAGDIVNMAVAKHAGSPVLLVGNIDVGGVFAQLLGTLSLLEDDERRHVRGLVVNRFRGDPSLFADGVRILEERGGVPVLGVVPYLRDLGLPDEDAVSVETDAQPPPAASLDIAVVRLPRIANFDDFDPLRLEAGVRYVASADELGRPHAVILPGTKSTRGDLQWLREAGLADAILDLARRGAAVVGVCGGYQMLGRAVRDPEGVEGEPGEAPGLGLLDVETYFGPAKVTRQVRARVRDGGGPGWLARAAGMELDAYEIHMGRTVSPRPWLEVAGRGEGDGAVSADGRVWGCYLHGLFANDDFRRAWLASLAPPRALAPGASAAARVERGLDRLADAFAAAVPADRLDQIIREGVGR